MSLTRGFSLQRTFRRPLFALGATSAFSGSPQLNQDYSETQKESEIIKSTWKFEEGESDLKFTVYGEPVPLPRHRMGKGRMYNPVRGLQKEFAEASKSSLPSKPLNGPLAAYLVFYFPEGF